MVDQVLNFSKVNSIPSSNLEVGTIYFENSTHCIAVAVSDSSAVYYSGVRNVTWNNETQILSIVGPHGTTQQLDLSQLIALSEFQKLMNAIGVVKDSSGNFVFDTDSDGIKGTNYLDTSAASTVKGALTVLDSKLKAVEASAGVMSVGGQAGAITLLGGQDASGMINLTMGGSDGHRIDASIVGLDTAAYRPESYFDVSGAAEAVRGKTTDSSDASTVYGAKKKAEEILGTPSDTSAANTVYGAKQKAEDVKTELLGDAATDTSASKTIEGLIKKIDENNTDSELHLYSGKEGTEVATEVTADGQTYRLVQGSGSTAATIATFNIEKDSFVTDGSVVKHDTSAEPWGPAGTYIQLALRTTDTSTGTSSEKIIYIPAESLVNIYTAKNDGHNVTVTVSGYEISADVSVTTGTSQLNFTGIDTSIATVAGTTIKVKLDTLESVAVNTPGGVQLAEANNTLSATLIDNAVTTVKIVDGNVTTEKLDSSVLAALEKANNSVQSVTGETAVANSSYIEISVEASTNANKEVTLSSHANVTMHDVSTATGSANGLATAYDVQQYVKKYVAEQLVWKQFD